MAGDTAYTAIMREASSVAKLGTTAGNGRVSTTTRVRFPDLFEVPPFTARDTAGDAIGEMRVVSTVEFIVTTSGTQRTYRRSIVDGENSFTLTVSP